MQITLFQADCLYQPANCQYPHKMVITSKTDMAKLQSRDHVCAEYKNNYRSNNNFIVSDNMTMNIRKIRMSGLQKKSWMQYFPMSDIFLYSAAIT